MTYAAHRRLLVGILVLAAGCASAPPPHANQAPSGVAEQQILVMVKESAVRHYRPGPASLSGYDSAASHARSQKVAESLAHDYDLKLVGDWAMPALGVRCFLVELAPNQTPAEMAAIRPARRYPVQAATTITSTRISAALVLARAP